MRQTRRHRLALCFVDCLCVADKRMKLHSTASIPVARMCLCGVWTAAGCASELTRVAAERMGWTRSMGCSEQKWSVWQQEYLNLTNKAASQH